jgi:hypothetical protein
MAVGPFTLTNPGLLESQDGSIAYPAPNMYAVLILNAHGAPALTEATYADISTEEVAGGGDYAPKDVGLTISGITGTVKVEMAQVNFGDTVTISARYFYILLGDEASPQASDPILGFMDLNDGGGGDVSSSNSDFKVDDNAANGLYQVTKAP